MMVWGNISDVRYWRSPIIQSPSVFNLLICVLYQQSRKSCKIQDYNSVWNHCFYRMPHFAFYQSVYHCRYSPQPSVIPTWTPRGAFWNGTISLSSELLSGFLWTSLFVWHIGSLNNPRWFWIGGCPATLFLPTSVILSYCLPSRYLFYHVTFPDVTWFVILPFSTSAVMVCYLPPCQLSCHIIFLYIICPITLFSFTSVVLPLYLLPHQLSWNITFFYISFSVTLPSSMSFVLSHYLPSHWLHPSLFRCIRKIAKAAVSFVMSGCPSLFQSTWNTLAPTGWNLMKFGFWRIKKKNLSRKFKHN